MILLFFIILWFLVLKLLGVTENEFHFIRDTYRVFTNQIHIAPYSEKYDGNILYVGSVLTCVITAFFPKINIVLLFIMSLLPMIGYLLYNKYVTKYVDIEITITMKSPISNEREETVRYQMVYYNLEISEVRDFILSINNIEDINKGYNVCNIYCLKDTFKSLIQLEIVKRYGFKNKEIW